jgi:uncharacterized membrane protein HdeD (DUF308 family)
MVAVHRRTEVGPARRRWVGFLCLGLVLAVCGVFAIIAPKISTLATGIALGVALASAGVLKILQTFTVKEWPGFVWQMLCGIVEVIGGIVIYLHPLKGAIAITLLISVVFAVEGVSQIALALKIRPQSGWGWLLASGLIALGVSGVLALKLPITSPLEPGAVAGISLLFAGLAYVAIAYAARRAAR